MVNSQHIPTSLDASGTIRFENNKFDGTKLPLVVCTSLNHDKWYELQLCPESTNRNSASFQPWTAPESRQGAAYVRR
jgi:hypothetical protein